MMVKVQIAISLSFAFLATAYQPFGRLVLTMVKRTFLSYSYPLARRLTEFGLSVRAPFTPAFGIESQSLPKGMRFHRCTYGMGLTPT